MKTNNLKLKDFDNNNFLDKCNEFADILLKYNKIHNVSGVKNYQDIMDNILDSIYPIKFLDMKNINNIIDIGSGAGFPGLILGLYFNEINFTLFEPILKKSAFLHLIKSKLGLHNIEIISKRVEKNTPFEVDLITSRAVSETKMLINISKKYIKKDTKMLLYKGNGVKAELDNIGKYDIIQNGKRYYLYIKEINVI